MNQKMLSLLLIFVLAMSCLFAGCHKASEKMDEAVYGGLDKIQDLTTSDYSSYAEIFDDYSAQLEKKGKTLAKELTKEAPARYEQDGKTLSKLLNEKTKELNKIYQAGIRQMSEFMLLGGDTEETYDEWQDALYDSYRDAEDGIMDAYTEALQNVK